MKEKTKQILRYVACGLGGVALGIGLLGGLAMCASSGKSAKAESVNTIYSAPKREQTTTTESGYSGYRFEIPSRGAPADESTTRFSVYSMDMSTYTPTLTLQSDVIYMTEISLSGIQNVINQYINIWTPTAVNEYNFVLFEGSLTFPNGQYREWFYASFLYGTSYTVSVENFILTNRTIYRAWRLSVDDTALFGQTSNFYMLTSQETDYIPYSATQGDILINGGSYVFQDVSSYYRELGYQSGHDAGYNEGNSAGYSSGYGEGYADGYDQGYTDGDNVGYWAGYNEGIGTASSFTDISGNLNAVYDLTTMGILSPTWQYLHGLTDVKIHTLLQFFDKYQNTWDCYIVDGVSPTQPTGTRTMYVDVAQLSSLDCQTIGFAIYTTASNVGLQEVGTAHFEFAQIRNVNNKSLANKLILLYGWTQNDVSYQAGYQAGLKDGFENTNTNNVFSLFTSAFNAVGGFFNLKIFGFLPLYWFFLTPLFVAIITLLLRMVKH